MRRTIISDASCLIVLSNIDELKILRLVYGQITITPEIVSEFGEFLPSWFDVLSPKNKLRQSDLELQVDRGEASAIALALEIPGSTLIVDDQRARKLADKLGIDFTGTLGVIVKAKLCGIISSVKPNLRKIQWTEFRVGNDGILSVLSEAGEEIEYAAKSCNRCEICWCFGIFTFPWQRIRGDEAWA